MLKLVVAYRHPTDIEEFERRYKQEHIDMARRIPHMSKIEFGKVVGLMDGSKAPYHRIAELYFPNQAELGKAASSAEAQAAIGHAADIASGGLDAMVVETED
ncbi:MAG: hypothetical protein AUH32_04840 [Actinobacteria bacterium 13_1_40CM_66_12]|nr:MAG: hypothetical protein AUH32_04840 [Actinobacteria bacterium 13_1_40CM_66_12]